MRSADRADEKVGYGPEFLESRFRKTKIVNSEFENDVKNYKRLLN